MTQDEIIRMARDVGLLPENSHPAPETRHTKAKYRAVERFAALVEARVAAAEREACAKVAEDDDHTVEVSGYYAQLGDARATANNIAKAIRSRGAA